jgi:hypothetical protein
VRKTVTVVAVLCVAAGSALAGCSGRSGAAWVGQSGLRQALSRVAATDVTRGWVGYDAIAELTGVVGKTPKGGLASLLLFGTELVNLSVARQAPTDTGIAPLDADYGISAGKQPQMVTVLIGGQHADRIGTSITTLGWTRNGDRYVAPAKAKLPASIYALEFNQVRPDGSDVVIGRPGVDLGTAGHPAGRTLADDPTFSGIADCLGDVAVAELTNRWSTIKHPAGWPVGVPSGVQVGKLTEIGVGVLTPKSTSDTPRAVVCTAWADKAAADGYAKALPDVLGHAKAFTNGLPYAQVLTHSQLTNVGGDAHIVRWTADETGADEAMLIFQLTANENVPGLG